MQLFYFVFLFVWLFKRNYFIWFLGVRRGQRNSQSDANKKGRMHWAQWAPMDIDGPDGSKIMIIMIIEMIIIITIKIM